MYSEETLSDGFAGVPRQPGSAAARMVRFAVLGPLGVQRGGVDHAPTSPKLLQLLALLAVRPGRIVTSDTIVQELWAGVPPRSVRTTLHTYIYHLRRCIDADGPAGNAETMLATKAPGYVLRVDAEQVDLFRFGRLRQEGLELQRRGRHAEAAHRYRAALRLWSGPPFSNVHCGPVLSAYAVELDEQRRGTQHLRIEAEIAGGHHRELIGELCSLSAANPLDEALHVQLMRVLGRSGRRSDAVSVYRDLRRRLTDELGVEPCDELQLLHRDLLSEGEHR